MIEKIKKLFLKYREIIMYLISGFVTTLVSWISYAICYELLNIPNVPSQIISWVLAVVVAFVTNKLWAFESKSWERKLIVKEASKFFGARVFTGIIETVMMWLGVDVAGFSGMLTKIVVSIIVIILNYVLSKLLVFKTTGDNK